MTAMMSYTPSLSSCRGSTCQKFTGIWCKQTWCVLHLHCITHFWSQLQSDLYTPEGAHTSASDWDIHQCRHSHQVWSCARCDLHNTGGCNAGWCGEYSRHHRLHHSARWWAMAAILPLGLLCKWSSSNLIVALHASVGNLQSVLCRVYNQSRLCMVNPEWPYKYNHDCSLKALSKPSQSCMWDVCALCSLHIIVNL